jgi:transcription-repair coupling factor (superfamily II helicase)
LLGEEQSGQIQTIGFSLYMEMLERAVKAIRQGKQADLEKGLEVIDVNLHIPALIPNDYLPDVHLRLVMYKRLASCEHKDDLRDLQVEMIDRFGLLPEQTKNLIRVTELKIQAQALGVKKLEANARGGSVEFASDTKVDPMKIVSLVQSQPRVFKLQGANKLSFSLAMETTEKRLEDIQQLMKSLV